jgi:hypothetical protein
MTSCLYKLDTLLLFTFNTIQYAITYTLEFFCLRSMYDYTCWMCYLFNSQLNYKMFGFNLQDIIKNIATHIANLCIRSWDLTPFANIDLTVSLSEGAVDIKDRLTDWFISKLNYSNKSMILKYKIRCEICCKIMNRGMSYFSRVELNESFDSSSYTIKGVNIT